MALKLYPVGIQTFEEIIKRNLLYIDKTEYVYRMTHGSGKYFFLGRPRRFGKSLLVSTFESYFSGKKELFKGLAIERLEEEWTEYPVLYFSMAGGKHMEKDQLQRYLLYVVKDNEERYGIESDSIDPNIRLSHLIKALYQKAGKQVVVLIDEYDAPMLDVAHEKESLDMFRNIMRNFYSPLKDCDPMLRFVFLTGITKFSQVSIFSVLNNIKNFTLLTHFVVDVEAHTPNGRVDVVMLTDGTLYLIELKLNQSAQAAMQQINLKQYDQRFALCGKPVVKVDINFDATKGNIEDWMIE